MGRKPRIVLGLLVLLLLALAAGAYAWDSSQSGTIADGVKVGSVDLSGMSESEARAALDQQVVAPLNEPLVVKWGGDKFTLSKNDLAVTANVDEMVSEAVAAGRDQSLPTRIWRYVTGGTLNVDIKPQISYDEVAVDRFVHGVAGNIDQKPQDATIEPSTTSLAAVQGQSGIKLDKGKLRDDIASALEQTGTQSRVVHASVSKVKPNVTRADLAQQYPTYITVDRAGFTLRLFKDLKLVKSYPIAVGMQGLETPAGLYTINDKTVNPTWYVPNAAWAGSLAGQTIPGGAPNNPLIARWLGFYNGAGIHGTADLSSLGSAASHGCIRMNPSDVIDLYDRVPLGTPIYIQ